MLVVLLAAAAVILGGTVMVAIGRGGEMTEFTADVRPIDTHIETAADVALLRPPVALWGYDRRSTDEALNVVARTVTERDIEIAALRRQIADMQSARGGGPGARAGAAGGAGTSAEQPAVGGPATGGFGQAGTFDRPGEAAWGPGAFAGPEEFGEPRQAGRPDGAGTPGQPGAPGLPGGTQPWSAWERPGPEPGGPVPEYGEPAEPGETG